MTLERPTKTDEAQISDDAEAQPTEARPLALPGSEQARTVAHQSPNRIPPERWERIDYLFHEALATEAFKRAEFLAAACSDDDSLRLEVESLISSHEETEDFIEAPPGDIAAEMLKANEAAFAPGEQIENYRIVRQLGAGGMGEVYLADDTRLNR